MTTPGSTPAIGRKRGTRRRSRVALLLAAWHQAERDLGLLRNVSIDEARARASRARSAYMRAVERPPAHGPLGASEVSPAVAGLGGEFTHGQRGPSRPADPDGGLGFEEDLMWPYEAEWAS